VVLTERKGGERKGKVAGEPGREEIAAKVYDPYGSQSRLTGKKENMNLKGSETREIGRKRRPAILFSGKRKKDKRSICRVPLENGLTRSEEETD